MGLVFVSHLDFLHGAVLVEQGTKCFEQCSGCFIKIKIVAKILGTQLPAKTDIR